MSVYFPQGAMSLRVRWEDFGSNDPKLLEVYKLNVIPKRFTVNINDYTTADTFEAEIDYKSFPFDPRTIRSLGVSIFLVDNGKLYDADDDPAQIVPSKDNVMFQGFADEESISFDDEKRTVKIEGRDFTGILVDAKYLEGKPIDMGIPLDQLVTQLLQNLPAAKDLIIDNRTGQTLPTLKQFYPEFGSPLAGHRNTQKEDTYWGIIQDLVARAGLVCYIEIDKLVISTPRILYNKAQAKQFMYGANIRSLEFKRKLGRHKGFNVIVRCLDVMSKQVIDAKIPEEGTEAWSKSSGIPNKRVQVPVIRPDGSQDAPHDAPFMSFRVTNVADKAHLIGVGEKIFEELSRQQIEGSFETYEMSVQDKLGKIFDLTKMRVGTPVAVEIDSNDLDQISRFGSVSLREKFLVSKGYPLAFAKVFAQTMGNYTPIFYTKAANFTLDSENGYKLKVDFLNFIDLDNKGISFG